MLCTFTYHSVSQYLFWVRYNNTVAECYNSRHIEKAKQIAKSDQLTINKTNNKGQTALMLAAIRTQEDVVRSILEAGAAPNMMDINGSTALIEAAYKGQPSLVELLLKYEAEIDLSNKNGWTPLFFAIKQNYYPVAKLLLRYGANVNLRSKDGTTPLLLSSMHGNTAIANLLLANGADPNSQNEEGMTPLMYAVLGEHSEIVRTLILNGAKNNLRSKDNQTARDLAEENGLTQLVELMDTNNHATGITNQNNQDTSLVILKNVKGWLDGEELSPTSIRAFELRAAAGHFLDMLCESGLFDRVDTLDETNSDAEALFVSLIFEESEDRNVGSNSSKAFLSGFFTLGLIPPSADYGYKSTITLLVEASGGQNQKFRASSDTTATWQGDPRIAAYTKKASNAKESARRIVTHQAFESLISQLETSSFISEQ